jgi:hypothetical protein
LLPRITRKNKPPRRRYIQFGHAAHVPATAPEQKPAETTAARTGKDRREDIDRLAIAGDFTLHAEAHLSRAGL